MVSPSNGRLCVRSGGERNGRAQYYYNSNVAVLIAFGMTSTKRSRIVIVLNAFRH